MPLASLGLTKHVAIVTEADHGIGAATASKSAECGAAMRRRMTVEPSEPYVLGDLTIDYRRRRVSLAGRQVQLILTEYGMLAELSAHAGRVLTHEHLLERDWAGRSKGNVRPMHTMVSKLRRKLGGDAATSPTSSPSPASASVCPGGRGGNRTRNRNLRRLSSRLESRRSLLEEHLQET